MVTARHLHRRALVAIVSALLVAGCSDAGVPSAGELDGEGGADGAVSEQSHDPAEDGPGTESQDDAGAEDEPPAEPSAVDAEGKTTSTEEPADEDRPDVCHSETTVSEPVAPEESSASDDPDPPPDDFEAPPRDGGSDECPHD